MQDLKQIMSLEEWDKFADLNRTGVFLRRYWHGLAVGPFVLVLVVFHRVLNEPSHAWRYVDTLLMATLGWAMLVVIYTMVTLTRLIFIRCPRCGWKFGPTTRCASCGLPRSDNLPLTGQN